MSQSSTLYVGMDVHQEAIAVAYVAKEHEADGVYLGSIGPRQCDIDPRIRKLQAKNRPLVWVYEAGPCGDGLFRDLTHIGRCRDGCANAFDDASHAGNSPIKWWWPSRAKW